MATIYTRAGKGSALTWTEGDANITNLNTAKIENVVEDTTPQLGGNLDVNGNQIVSVSNANIVIAPNGTGKIQLDGVFWPASDGTSNQVLKTDGAGNTSWTTISSGGISDIVQDTTPQLGGNLDTNGFGITDASGSGFGPKIYSGSQNDPIQIQSRYIEFGTVSQTNPTDIYTKGASTMRFGPNEMAYSNIQIKANTNGNIELNPEGTGLAKVKNLQYYEKINALGTTSGTITPDAANGNVQSITLSGNLTFSAFSNPVAGQSITLIINTNGTSRTLTSTMKFAGGSKTLSTTSTTDIISVFYDGTTYWASLSKDFK
jgi:hypothetical protein